MNVKRLIPTIVFCLIGITLFAQEKPNVLFIAIDDLNDFVNCMNGSIKVATPNIDRLASQGTLFTNAHCQAPLCGPSRASIMTGLHPSSTGIYKQIEDENIKGLNALTAQTDFMPDYFETYGYQTMAVGKIFHKGDAAKVFDEYGGGFSWFGPKPAQRFKYDPGKLPNKTGYTETDWGAYPDHDSLMTDYKVAEWSVRKLNQDYDKPFFMAVGFLRPHVPWYVPQKWLDMFPLDKVKTPPYNADDFNDIPEIAKKVTSVPMMPTTEELISSGEWKNAVQAYMACIAFVDAQVGKVLDALEKSKHANNTIVVLWSDHGYHLGEKNRFAKVALWERDTRTVLIIKTPDVRAGHTSDAPVQLIDMYPTLLELCHLPPYPLADGHSLVELLKSPKKKWPYPALTFYGKNNVAVRDDRYRFIRYEDGSEELYDIKKDPNEWTNLAGKTNQKEIIKKLEKFIPTPDY